MRRYHGRDLRKGRVTEHGRPYLVTSVTLNRKNIFDDWHAGRLLIHELQLAVSDGLVNSLAWVVMPDHFHWLMIPGSDTLSSIMHRVKHRSAHSINIHLATSGPLWQKGYHDHALRREEDIKTVARYIVANPLRAGLVDHIGDYPLWDATWL